MISFSLPSNAHKKWMNIFNLLSNGKNKNKAIWHGNNDFHTTTNFLIKHIKMANGDIYSKSDKEIKS